MRLGTGLIPRNYLLCLFCTRTLPGGPSPCLFPTWVQARIRLNTDIILSIMMPSLTDDR
jgi:hypothetical protein